MRERLSVKRRDESGHGEGRETEYCFAINEKRRSDRIPVRGEAPSAERDATAFKLQ